MRPLLVDFNNLSYSKETLIYYSRAKLAIWILFITALSTFSIYLLTIEKGYILSLIFSIIIIVSVNFQYKILKRINEVQFRINSNGMQFRNEKLISWSNVENERLVIEGDRQQTRRVFFIYYIIDQDQIMKFDIEPLHFRMDEFRHTLIIHRNRFERAKKSNLTESL